MYQQIPSAPQQAGYPPYPTPNQGGYPAPNQGGYPAPNQGGYPPPNQGGYPAPAQAGYPAPNQGDQIPKYAGEMPSENIKDDPSFKDPGDVWQPPAEPPHSIPGYGMIGYDETPLPPPPPYEDLPRNPPTRDPVSGSIALTDDQVKSALLEFVGENCCYRKGPAEEMNFTDLQASSAFHYKLESYCEGRTTKWQSEPYTGQPLVMTGPPPGPWEFMVPVPDMFKESKLKVEVPNTAYVKPCHMCHGRGYKRCTRCHGRGEVQCSFCNGRGERSGADGEMSRCSSCSGSGHKRCISCHGYGQNRCVSCQGNGSLRWFIQLTVKWKTHDDDHIAENNVIPNKLIEKASGEVALKETALRVWPINHFPHQAINQASNKFIAEHANKFPTERMLMQQHTVRIVPITTVFYKYGDDSGTFFVYGKENKVYFPDYPAKCCCTIL